MINVFVYSYMGYKIYYNSVEILYQIGEVFGLISAVTEYISGWWWDTPAIANNISYRDYILIEDTLYEPAEPLPFAFQIE